MRAIVLAGGRGTRLRPLTDTRPKPLVPFLGEPFAVGLLRRLAEAGCTEAAFLVGADVTPFAGLPTAGETLDLKVSVHPEEVPLDTAGAARRLLRGTGDGPVLVCNGDILTDLDLPGLAAAHERAGAVATLALAEVDDPSSFGLVERDGAGWVRRFAEKPQTPRGPATVNAGTYVLAAEVFDAFPGDGPLSFERSVFPGLLDAGRPVLGWVSPAFWSDLGTPERYLAGHRAVLDGRCAWPLAPAMTLVAGPAAVHREARIAASAQIEAGVVLGAGCVVRTRARLHAAVLHDGVTVGDGAQVGPRVVAGPGAVIEAGAVVGPDVVLGDGAVVPAGGVLRETMGTSPA